VPQTGPGENPEFTYIDISSVDNQEKRITEPKVLPARDAPSRARQQVQSGDVLVSMTRPNLNAVALVPDDLDGIVASTGFDVLRALEVDPRWLYFTVKSRGFVSAMSELVQGALYPAVRSADIRGYEIPVPPLAEQRRIAEKLDELQARSRTAREALETIPPLLEKFRQSVLAAAFRGDLTADWREQNPGVEPASVLLNRMRSREMVSTRRGVPEEVEKPDALSSLGLPPTWAIVPIAELLRRGALIDLKDGNHGANHPKRDEFSESGVPFITAAQIDDNHVVDYNGAPKVSGKALERLRVGFSEPGDVILTHKGTVGRTAINDRSCVLSPQTTYYRCHRTAILPGYLLHFFASPNFYDQLAAVMSQTTRDFVPISMQYRLFVILPPIREQQEILQQLEDQLQRFTSIDAASQSAHSLTVMLNQSILAKAFRGELVPQDPNDEPASVLLERVRQEQSSRQPQRKSRAGVRS
jgi:type I restriction enzyme S subunit